MCHTDHRGHATSTVRTFDATTPALLSLQAWLIQAGVTHVAMEATGSYWKPVYNLLESSFATWVVNPAHMRNVPGRKTDVKDAAWIAELLRHGLLTPSFIPDKPQRELRELTRQRTRWLAERAREVNRVQKVLEGANIKLASVATDVLGVSGRAMLEGLIAGDASPEALADLARGRLKQKHTALIPALTGQMGDHQRFLLRRLLDHIDYLDRTIVATDTEIARRLDPQQARIALLDTIPGIDRRTAEAILAELGSDLARFPDADHLTAWAGLAPGQNEWWQTAPEPHPPRQPRPAGGLGPSRLGGEPHQNHVFGGLVPSLGQTDAREKSGGRLSPPPPRDHLPGDDHRTTVSGTRSGVS